MFYKISSSELLSKSPGNLLRNFLRHVLDMKSGEELQQQVYNAVLRRTIKRYISHKDDVLTLTLLNNTEIKIDPSSLLDCITASGVPLNNIKKIQARLMGITEKDWEGFYVQTLTGTLLQVEVHKFISPSRAGYSPLIHKMLQSSRLTQFR